MVRCVCVVTLLRVGGWSNDTCNTAVQCNTCTPTHTHTQIPVAVFAQPTAPPTTPLAMHTERNCSGVNISNNGM